MMASWTDDELTAIRRAVIAHLVANSAKLGIGSDQIDEVASDTMLAVCRRPRQEVAKPVAYAKTTATRLARALTVPRKRKPGKLGGARQVSMLLPGRVGPQRWLEACRRALATGETLSEILGPQAHAPVFVEESTLKPARKTTQAQAFALQQILAVIVNNGETEPRWEKAVEAAHKLVFGTAVPWIPRLVGAVVAIKLARRSGLGEVQLPGYTHRFDGASILEDQRQFCEQHPLAEPIPVWVTTDVVDEFIRRAGVSGGGRAPAGSGGTWGEKRMISELKKLAAKAAEKPRKRRR